MLKKRVSVRGRRLSASASGDDCECGQCLVFVSVRFCVYAMSECLSLSPTNFALNSAVDLDTFLLVFV